MPSYFNEKYYLKVTLTHFQKTGQLDSQGNPYTEASLLKAIQEAGLDLEQHYLNFGRQEQLNPNAYFNEYEYLQAKLKLVHEKGELDEQGLPYTLESLKASIAEAGFTPVEYYETWGYAETTNSGHLVNPSNAFDSSAYVAARLAHLTSEANPNILERTLWQDKTVYELGRDMLQAGSPVSHYQEQGYLESKVTKIALVQTVPMEQRVANDPARVRVTGEVVPSNYNPATNPPSQARAQAVLKPADMGGLAPALVAPKPIPPFLPQPVPGDPNYVPSPANLVDSNSKPIIAPTTQNTGTITDAWVMVDLATGGGLAYNLHGAVVGALLPGTIDPGIQVSDIVITSATVLAPAPSASELAMVRTEPMLFTETSSSITLSSAPDTITHVQDVPNVEISETAGRFILAGMGYDNLTLSSQGILSNNGLAICTGSFNQNDVLDASALRSESGTININTSAFTLQHQVIGSTNSNNNVILGINATAYTGGGLADNVTAEFLHDMVINTGAGNDQVQVSRMENSSVELGSGDDIMTIGSVTALSRSIFINGGTGYDTLRLTKDLPTQTATFTLNNLESLDLTAAGAQIVALSSESNGLKEVKFGGDAKDKLMLDSSQLGELTYIEGKGQLHISDMPESETIKVINNLELDSLGINFNIRNQQAVNSRLSDSDLLNESILNNLLATSSSGLSDGFKFTTNSIDGILLNTVNNKTFLVIDADQNGFFSVSNDFVVDFTGVNMADVVGF